MFSKVEKCVHGTECIHAMHSDLCRSPEEIAGFSRYVAYSLLGPLESQLMGEEFIIIF